MKIAISHPAELGQLITQVRRRQGLRQEDLAAHSGSSHVTLKKIEHGADGVAIGRVLSVLKELGIRMELDLPDEYAKKIAAPPRRRRKTAP